MKKLINLDLVIWAMLQKEAELYDSNVTALVRFSVLDFLTKSHAAKMPFLFRDEKFFQEEFDIIQRFAREARAAGEQLSGPVLNCLQEQDFSTNLYLYLVTSLNEAREQMKKNKP